MRLTICCWLLPLLMGAEGGTAEARKAFEKAMQAARQKKTAEARRLLERAVELDARHARAWLELGRMQALAGETEAGRKSFQSAAAADPKDCDPHLQLAALAQSRGDWPGLLEASQRVIAINPVDYPVAFLGQGIAFYQLGRKQEAEQSLRRAEQMDTARRFPQTWRLLGAILRERGDMAGAAAQWREFVRLAPDSPAAKEIRAMLPAMEPRAADAPAVTFRSETELVLVRFQVSPRRGRFLTDLRAEDIEIREDGVAQKTALFEGGRFYPRAVPIEMMLLFDASGSVQSAGNLRPHVFHKSLLEEYENVAIGILGFSEQLQQFTAPTRLADALKRAMDSVMLIPAGRTPLFLSIAETVRLPATRPGALRMLVVFSDGESNSPGDLAAVEPAIRAAQDAGVAVYPVLLSRSLGASAMPGATAGAAPPAQQDGMPRLPSADLAHSLQAYLRLAHGTGGERFETIANDEAIPTILRALARRIQFDYVAGYYPSTSGAKKRREVEVVVKAKERGTVVGGRRSVTY